MVAGERDEAIDLAAEPAAVGQRHVDHVTRDRDHRHGLGDRVERCHDHRVRQVRVPADPSIDPDEEDVLAGNRRRRRGRRRDARRAWRVRRQRDLGVRDGRRGRRRVPGARRRRVDRDDLVGCLASDLRRVRDECVGHDEDDREERDRDRVAPVEPREPPVEEARPDRGGAPGEEQGLEPEQDGHGRRVQGDPEEPGRRDQEQPGADQEEHRECRDAEQRGAAATAGYEVAETGDDGIEEGMEVTGPPARCADRAALRRIAHVGGAYQKRSGPIRSATLARAHHSSGSGGRPGDLRYHPARHWRVAQR